MKFCCRPSSHAHTLLASHLRRPAAQNASDPAARFERKLQHVQSNGAQAHPDPSPTEFTEQEINAYFASGKVELPAGVRSVVFQEQPGIIVGTSRVDFDQLKAGKNSYNPLLSVFSGVHEVVVTSPRLWRQTARDWFMWIQFRSTASRFPASSWKCLSKNTSSRSIRISASTPALRCRPAWMRRPSGCTKSP